MTEFIAVMDLPIPALSPNARTHHHAKARAVAKYRDACAKLALVALAGRDRPLWTAGTIQYVFYLPRNRFKSDVDNLEGACKALQDGLVDAGILANDDNLTRLPSKRELDNENPCVIVRVVPEAKP